MAGLGELEKAVMDHLWSSAEPQTVRQVHEALTARRELAYTTVMTVLQRLAKKNLVTQQRDDRAHRYAPVHGRDELVASLMVDALQQADDSGRAAALVHFVGRVNADEAAALREALAKLEADQEDRPRTLGYGLRAARALRSPVTACCGGSTSPHSRGCRLQSCSP